MRQKEGERKGATVGGRGRERGRERHKKRLREREAKVFAFSAKQPYSPAEKNYDSAEEPYNTQK